MAIQAHTLSDALNQKAARNKRRRITEKDDDGPSLSRRGSNSSLSSQNTSASNQSNPSGPRLPKLQLQRPPKVRPSHTAHSEDEDEDFPAGQFETPRPVSVKNG